MTSRTRAIVLTISAPVIIFAFIGGYLGQVLAEDGTYQGLRIFEDVVSLVLTNYVEPVDVGKAMTGAMKGLADSLDPASAYLTPALVSTLEAHDPGGPAEVGLDLTRQYYLRVVSTLDGSPAARAGIRPGDFIRAIDSRPTRGMSPYEGMRLLRGEAGTHVSLLVIRGNAADPHMVDLVREEVADTDVISRMVGVTTGYLRVTQFLRDTPAHIRASVETLGDRGAERYIIDVRGTSRGDVEQGIAAARLFVKDGTLAIRLERDNERDPVTAESADGAITAPLALLVDVGTAGPAEVFAAAIDGNGRGELIGSGTLGNAARQRLVKLPDQSGLWLTYLRYLTPSGDPIHERGLAPDIEVPLPEIEFGAAPPTPDAALQRAIEYLAPAVRDAA